MKNNPTGTQFLPCTSDARTCKIYNACESLLIYKNQNNGIDPDADQ